MVRGQRGKLRGVEGDSDVRPSPGAVEEGDLAPMLLDNLLDDRETKARPPHPRRHVGLRQPFTVFGKADACVQHVDDEVADVVVELQLDAIAGDTVFAAISSSFNGFYAVFDNVRECLS